MIDVVVAFPSSPHPTLAQMYQYKNDDTLTDYSLFYLGMTAVYRLERHNHHE
jgi:hypothetical protein